MAEAHVTEADLDAATTCLKEQFTMQLAGLKEQLGRIEQELGGIKALNQAQLEAKEGKAFEEGLREARLRAMENRMNKLVGVITAVGLAAVAPLLARMFDRGGH